MNNNKKPQNEAFYLGFNVLEAEYTEIVYSVLSLTYRYNIVLLFTFSFNQNINFAIWCLQSDIIN